MLTMKDIYILEGKIRQTTNPEELDALFKIRDEYKKDTNYEYLNKEARNYAMRVYRLNKKTRILLNKPCLFLTFTLAELISEEELIEQVKLWFKNVGIKKGYFNLDRGSVSERLHAHALVQSSKIDLKRYKWKFGALNCKTVHSPNDYLKLSRYIMKFTKHSVKNSVVGTVIHLR